MSNQSPSDDDLSTLLDSIFNIAKYEQEIYRVSPTLKQLAARVKPDLKDDPAKLRWVTFLEPPQDWQCLICDKVFMQVKGGTSFKIMFEHGLEHIKEHNLLAFI